MEILQMNLTIFLGLQARTLLGRGEIEQIVARHGSGDGEKVEGRKIWKGSAVVESVQALPSHETNFGTIML